MLKRNMLRNNHIKNDKIAWQFSNMFAHIINTYKLSFKALILLAGQAEGL